MPRKRNTYKKKKYGGSKTANKYKKNKKVAQKAVTTRMRGVGLSDTLFVRLTYADYIHIAPGAVYSQYTYRGNSLYDPDYSGTGHQPMYFDQYAALYGYYRVMGAKIRVDTVNAANGSSVFFIMFPSTDIATLTSISLALEQGRARSPRVIPANNTGSAGRIQSYCSTRKACGLTKAQASDDSLASTVGATPSQVWYWNLFWESADNTTGLNCYVVIKITYYVQFYDKKVGVQS